VLLDNLDEGVPISSLKGFPTPVVIANFIEAFIQ
jgi:hypothetical protein